MFCLTLTSMRLRAYSAASVLASLVVILAVPVQAQIASYVDEHGKLIYINANPPAKPSSGQQKDPNSEVVSPPPQLAKVADAAARRNHLDPALVRAVIQAESGWNPYAVSRKGAYGLMQLMPSTAEQFGVGNVFDPAQNCEAGTEYLRELLDRYHGDLKKSLAAYNAGEQAVARYGGVPAYPETRAYVRKVTDTYFQSGSGHPVTDEAEHQELREVTDKSGRIVFTNE